MEDPQPNSGVPVEETGSTNVDYRCEKWNSSKTAFWKAVRQRAWIVPVVYTHFWVASAVALLAPYFPPLAASRSIPAWQYGFVFSAMKISMLPGSIVAQKLIEHVSPKAGYLGGQGCIFVFSICFGALYWIQSGQLLLVLAMVCSILGGCMYTTYSVSLYTLLTARFKDDGGLLIGTMECLWGIGTVLGSLIGGALIDLWEFPLPFFVIGGLLILSFPAMAIINPRSTKLAGQVNQERQNHPGEDKKYYKLMLDPMFLVNLFTVMLSWTVVSFNEPTLEPHLRQFNMSHTQIGTVFTVQYTGYSIGALIGGASSKMKAEKFFAFFGMLLCTLGYLILGPAPFIPITTNLVFIYLSQVFIGMGMAIMFVSPYMHALRDVVERAGYPPTIKTNAVVSSATYQFMVFGAVITSPLAGYLVEVFGYKNGSMFLFGVLAFWTVVTFMVWLKSEFATWSSGAPGYRNLIDGTDDSAVASVQGGVPNGVTWGPEMHAE